MKKILVLFTGGTIGSKTGEQAIDVDDSTIYELIRQYFKSPYAQKVEFETKQPFQLLSENLLPSDWEKLIQVVRDVDPSLYAGMIITHGSDTLPFTSACLSYTCAQVPIPIVLTASNRPLDHPKSDAIINFAGSVDFILDQQVPGVFVCFADERGEPTLYLGTRLMESDPFTDQYSSTYNIPYGRMANQRFIWESHPINPTIADLKARQSQSRIISNPKFSPNILYLKPYPGLNYEWFNFTDETKPSAVLHGLYHSGTASTRKIGAFSLKTLIEQCQQAGIKLYIAPIKDAAGDLYSTSVELIDAGAIPLENISVVAALVKLMLAYGSCDSEEQIHRFLTEEPLFYETHHKI